MKTSQNTSPFLSEETEKQKEERKEEFTNTSQKELSAVFLNHKENQNQEKEKIFSRDKLPTPVTILTGYLGAGKTTVILNLMQKVPKEYKIAWLKNEMGNTSVDTELADAQKTTMVKEMLQGCICHTLVGNLSQALTELAQTHPDRIIIETSGSATPAPIVWEIRKDPALLVDGVVTVIDAENFKGYINKSPSLKMQAKYTDLILINKHENLDERTLEDNLDDLYEINLDTPKIFTKKGVVSPEVLFGLESALFSTKESYQAVESEIQSEHQGLEADVLEFRPEHIFSSEEVFSLGEQFPKKNFYRIKGIVRTDEESLVINCAFGRCVVSKIKKEGVEPKIVCMGEDLESFRGKISEVFHIPEKEISLSRKGHHHEH